MSKIFSRLLLTFFLLPLSVAAAGGDALNVNVYFFHAEGCPHCAKEIEFLKDIKDEYPIQIWDYEIQGTPSHLKLLKSLETELETSISGTPFTVVGSTPITGFMSVTSTGAEIRQAIERVLSGKEPQILKETITTPPDGFFEALALETEPAPVEKEIPLPDAAPETPPQDTQGETKTEATCSLDSDTCTNPPKKERPSKVITLPFFGDLETKHLS